MTGLWLDDSDSASGGRPTRPDQSIDGLVSDGVDGGLVPFSIDASGAAAVDEQLWELIGASGAYTRDLEHIFGGARIVDD